MKKMKNCLGFEWCPFFDVYIKHIKINKLNNNILSMESFRINSVLIVRKSKIFYKKEINVNKGYIN